MPPLPPAGPDSWPPVTQPDGRPRPLSKPPPSQSPPPLLLLLLVRCCCGGCYGMLRRRVVCGAVGAALR